MAHTKNSGARKLPLLLCFFYFGHSFSPPFRPMASVGTRMSHFVRAVRYNHLATSPWSSGRILSMPAAVLAAPFCPSLQPPSSSKSVMLKQRENFALKITL